jgi:hypothetical protein
MPIEAVHRLNLPTLTVFKAALNASGPACRMSASATGYSFRLNSLTNICEATTFCTSSNFSYRLSTAKNT